MKDKLFADTNVLLYLLSQDAQKADQAEVVLNKGVMISVQVLNEVTHVLRRPLGRCASRLNSGVIDSNKIIKK